VLSVVIGTSSLHDEMEGRKVHRRAQRIPGSSQTGRDGPAGTGPTRGT
jgi:hypothetical protein